LKNVNELFRFKITFAVLISALCTMRSYAQSNGVPAPVHVVIDNYFGQEIRDPYRYMEENTPEAAIAAKWTTERYHAPSDDLNQPIDRSAAGKYVEVVRDLAVRIANRTDRPKWNEASFFKRFANGATH